ncbi:hypothetical protein BH23THE1_BH23THE1_31420 [soil metagenome]
MTINQDQVLYGRLARSDLQFGSSRFLYQLFNVYHILVVSGKVQLERLFRIHALFEEIDETVEDNFNEMSIVFIDMSTN